MAKEQKNIKGEEPKNKETHAPSRGAGQAEEAVEGEVVDTQPVAVKQGNGKKWCCCCAIIFVILVLIWLLFSFLPFILPVPMMPRIF